MSSMCCAKCAKCMAHCLCIKHVLVIRRGRIFLSTQLYFSTETKKKVRMGIIHDELEEKEKLWKVLWIFFQRHFLDLGQTCPKMICPRFIARWQTYFENTFFSRVGHQFAFMHVFYLFSLFTYLGASKFPFIWFMWIVRGGGMHRDKEV